MLCNIFKNIQQKPFLLDGAMGTLLFDMGLKQGNPPEVWNLEYPERIIEAHRSYVEAGSDIIQTNTFGATPDKLASAKLNGRCEKINQKAVELAKKAANPNTLIAGNLGPTGKLFPPMGDASVEQLNDSYMAQVTALNECGVDLFTIETMYDLREACVALKAAKSTGKPVVASMTFDKKKKGFFTIVGNQLIPSMKELSLTGADIVGFNCNVIPKIMLEMVQTVHRELKTPLVAQPNAGNPQVSVDGIYYDMKPEIFASELIQIVKAGARVIGGCCGTTPEFIRLAKKAINETILNE